MANNLVYNPAKLKRPVVFEGLPHIGTCSPTDIDFCIEVGGLHRFLIGDFKEYGKDVDDGQRLVLERTVNAFEKQGYTAVAFIAWHRDMDEVVDAAEAVVARVYTKGRWRECVEMLPLRERYRRFFNLEAA